VAERETGESITDDELLSRFVSNNDEAALCVIIHRHSPMVWGVCRRFLRHRVDAEDAFQSTFIVLIQKAARLSDRGSLANWLFGVARQIAIRIRAMSIRRMSREKTIFECPEPAAKETGLWHEFWPIVDEELAGLPANYRQLIVLCDMEGLTRKEVARQLQIPEGTVAGRLARARTLLSQRLLRRGIVIVSGALALLLVQSVAQSAPPAIPLPVRSQTTRRISRNSSNLAAFTMTVVMFAAIVLAISGDVFQPRPSLPMRSVSTDAGLPEAAANSEVSIGPRKSGCSQFSRYLNNCFVCHDSTQPIHPAVELAEIAFYECRD